MKVLNGYANYLNHCFSESVLFNYLGP